MKIIKLKNNYADRDGNVGFANDIIDLPDAVATTLIKAGAAIVAPKVEPKPAGAVG